MQRGRFYITFVLGVIFVVILVLYALYQSRNLILGPELIIISPKNGAVFDDPLVTIQATAKNVAFIYLNDRQTFVDENGVLLDKLLLAEGYNILTLRAKDRFGRETKKSLELIYRKPNPTATTTLNML
ncbi:MAG: hypothetical protein A2836_03240 [Candidatus Taylorbacteria bacterium RIFCSPHIGHO2_01_FULL_45_63]|uniref:Bacterial Ig domain-containing protein n=1 Tax=Candidatus Taylorbacteria bacterium RIFCSPHIGHO2_02_FULL_45_35 TaxID=1802311 RepID=A0A1G2MQW2_9BACT|nr:MAG: hypothetical protein A2836_03240 [Candidatus Taylorbacteria bacterium RIFCSPHIGHO2_01_FULL_45_63]OHA25392.1 MAG: hypothetical protein A3D56_01240 [Candidatus Taylorbacteria bacterium RIFCSPHIGHO2_02_FULL_45_35]OHA33578.1 MAG: hypothetical protein A3A22_03100 [Candidatus Taylorbacteria bacterium RIFCSPLOWO2_01_FULL_45_34b]